MRSMWAEGISDRDYLAQFDPGLEDDEEPETDDEPMTAEEAAAIELRKQPLRDCGHHEYDAHVEPVGGREMCRYCWAKHNWPSFVLCGCGRQFAHVSQACSLCQREHNEQIAGARRRTG